MPDDSQQGVLPDGSQGDSSQMPDGNGSTGNMPSMSGTPGYSPGGSNMSSGITSQYPGGETVQETEPEYTFEETVICSLSPNDIVEIPITIDELDINKVKEGQKCSITLDAFASQSFEGVIEDINYSGENSGGNTKYTVTVSMEKKEQMLLGMNASVTIAYTFIR